MYAHIPYVQRDDTGFSVIMLQRRGTSNLITFIARATVTLPQDRVFLPSILPIHPDPDVIHPSIHPNCIFVLPIYTMVQFVSSFDGQSHAAVAQLNDPSSVLFSYV